MLLSLRDLISAFDLSLSTHSGSIRLGNTFGCYIGPVAEDTAGHVGPAEVKIGPLHSTTMKVCCPCLGFLVLVVTLEALKNLGPATIILTMWELQGAVSWSSGQFCLPFSTGPPHLWGLPFQSDNASSIHNSLRQNKESGRS